MSDKKKIDQYAEMDQIGKEEKEAAKKISVEEPDKKKSKKEKADPVDDLKKQVESAQQEAKDAYDKYLRVSAEFDNFKKRTTREMTDFRKYANETILGDLLGVVDNLERAIESSSDHDADNASIIEGVRMTLKGVFDLMEKYQVTPIEALGQPFDPRYHQAFQQEESEDAPINTVLREFQKGYLLHDRLLRPSMVVVSKKKESVEAEEKGDDHISE